LASTGSEFKLKKGYLVGREAGEGKREWGRMFQGKEGKLKLTSKRKKEKVELDGTSEKSAYQKSKGKKRTLPMAQRNQRRGGEKPQLSRIKKGIGLIHNRPFVRR